MTWILIAELGTFSRCPDIRHASRSPSRLSQSYLDWLHAGAGYKRNIKPHSLKAVYNFERFGRLKCFFARCSNCIVQAASIIVVMCNPNEGIGVQKLRMNERKRQPGFSMHLSQRSSNVITWNGLSRKITARKVRSVLNSHFNRFFHPEAGAIEFAGVIFSKMAFDAETKREILRC